MRRNGRKCPAWHHQQSLGPEASSNLAVLVTLTRGLGVQGLYLQPTLGSQALAELGSGGLNLTIMTPKVGHESVLQVPPSMALLPESSSLCWSATHLPGRDLSLPRLAAALHVPSHPFLQLNCCQGWGLPIAGETRSPCCPDLSLGSALPSPDPWCR